MKNYGPVQIGTNIEHADGIDNRRLTTINPVAPNDRPKPEQDNSQQSKGPSRKSNKTSSPIRLRDKKPNKLEFFRVIKALCLDGFFEDEHGGKVNEKDVFAAFGDALNEDFSDYTKHLSEGRNHNSIPESANIFDELKEKYLAYERKLKEDKKARDK